MTTRWIHDGRVLAVRLRQDSRCEAISSRTGMLRLRRRLVVYWRFQWDPTRQCILQIGCRYSPV